MRSKSILVLAMIALLFGSASSCFAVMASFQGLGDLPGGSFFSWAHGVSADGSVVVGFGSSPSGLEAFIWDARKGISEKGEFKIGGLGYQVIRKTGCGYQGIRATAG